MTSECGRVRRVVVLQEEHNLELWFRANTLVTDGYEDTFAVLDRADTGRAVVVAEEPLSVDITEVNVLEAAVRSAEGGVNVGEDVVVCLGGGEHEAVLGDVVLWVVQLHHASALVLGN